MQWWWYLAIYVAIAAAGFAVGILVSLLRLRREGRLGKFTWH